jgi:hypothetical protein
MISACHTRQCAGDRGSTPRQRDYKLFRVHVPEHYSEHQNIFFSRFFFSALQIFEPRLVT